MTTYGLILAGGQGSRLGMADKGRLRLGGQSLVERVMGRMSGVAAPLLVSVAEGQSEAPLGSLVLPDLDAENRGPLAGLIAAAHHLSNAPPDDLLVTVAVDTPFLPGDYVRRLVTAMDGGAMAAMATWGENFYPTNAVWRLYVLFDLWKRARSGLAPTGPKALLAQVNAVCVDWGDTCPQDPFANLNTLDDLISLARRANAEAS